LILVGTSEQRQLPTIRSRCQVVRFSPLADADVADLLLERGLCSDRSAAWRAAARGGGSLARAAQWCDAGLVDFRRELLAVLSSHEPEQAAASKLISQFLDEAGKESAAKRQRLRLAVAVAEEYYRAALLRASATELTDEELRQALARARDWLPAEGPLACLEICHDAYLHIDANVNQAIFIEWWLDELAAAARTGRAAA
jgi:DNA polymerase-3 subunit delta'